jgi:predicted nuclease with TOPRIM domain
MCNYNGFLISACTTSCISAKERNEQKSNTVETKDNKISEEYKKLEENKVGLDERFQEFIEFIDKMSDLENKYIDDINDLTNKFNESDNVVKIEVYSELELEMN